MSHVLGGLSKKQLIKNSTLKLDANESYTEKRGSAKFYIDKICREYSDSLPSVGTSENANTNARIVPYTGVDQFYDEYSYFCKTSIPPMEPHAIAGRSCFRNVFNSMKKAGHVKLLRSKHGFQTCSICNHCNNIISGGAGGRDPIVREVTQKLKRLHMRQQHNERMNADIIMLRCASDVDMIGQPMEMFIDIDGMTVRTGDTPKLGK